MVTEVGAGELDWTPCDPADSRLAGFAVAASTRAGRDLTAAYHSLWDWSVEDVDGFWSLIWDHFGLPARPEGPALAEESMPGSVWFPGAEVNLAAEVFRGRDGARTALVTVAEGEPPVEISWAELEAEVGAFAAGLRRLGVVAGDRVCGYLPHGREAVVAFLATASLGGIWAVCGLDYPAAAAAARLEQLDPVVLVAALDHVYAGKRRDARPAVAELVAALPSVRTVVVADGVGADEIAHGTPWSALVATPAALEPESLPFDAPLWVLFSSGTTGRPKGIVHGHGGVVLEYLKMAALHWDLDERDRLLWYSTPSWMMWNFQVASLLSGCAIVCYAGSPGHPSPTGLWGVAASTRATVLGTSPAYLEGLRGAGDPVPAALGHPGLRGVGVTGSVFAPDLHRWLRDRVGPRVQIVSSSGGTDVVTAFAAGAPDLPVWVGELSGPCLGVALDTVDAAGRPVRGEVGELVVRRPMPSMPLRFWNDPCDGGYRDAYFDRLPGVWCHGDWATLTDRGTVVIHGRSDATLNRNGVRMGTADIYAPVEAQAEVTEALVIGVETPDGGYWMPLFVALADGATLDDELTGRITGAIRDQASARHVPDAVIAVPAIPHTRTGKKLEVPVKRLFLGVPLSDVADADSIDDPAALAVLADLATEFLIRTPTEQTDA
jgi:acetoacetyl-CoA synthetase